MRLVLWLGRAVLFLLLFAFALNNQQAVTVHGFFGYVWEAPLVVVMVCVFVAGAVLGALAMVPSWWRQWRQARRVLRDPAAAPSSVGEAGEVGGTSGRTDAAPASRIALDAAGNPMPPDVVRR